MVDRWLYTLKVWLARRWCDPQLWDLAFRHGCVIVTGERHGKIILPIFRVPLSGDHTAELAHECYRLRKANEELRECLMAERRKS